MKIRTDNNFIIVVAISLIILVSSFIIFRKSLIDVARIQKYLSYLKEPKVQVVELSVRNNSATSGEVILNEYNANLYITIKLDNSTIINSLPANIYKGTCDSLEGTIFNLMDINNNESVTKIDTNFKKLKNQAPFAIAIGQSLKYPETVIACAQLQ